MSPPGGRRHVLDRWARRCDGGRLLIGGSPGRRLRLTAAGAAALDRLLAGAATAADEPLRDRLRRHGLIHPLADRPGPEGLAVTFVVPNRDGGPALAALVARLRPAGAVIVVDDGSGDGSERAAAAAGATVIANRGRPGPAGARNTGLAAAGGEWVAFLDADCRGDGGWAAALAALLAEEPELALAAPRVLSAPAAGAIGRYERSRSPLDLGPDPGRCGPGRRLAYVPSAALLARRSALLALGGFDEGLRYGEDVDLCLRLDAAGWAVRYAPELAVEHRPRPTLGAFAAQRFHYGGSAAALDRRHPGLVPPLLVNRQSAAVLGLAAAGAARSLPTGAAAGLLAAAASAAAAGRGAGAAESGAGAPGGGAAADGAEAAGPAAGAAGRGAGAAGGGERGGAGRAIAALALRGHAIAARQLARAAVREWLPLTLAACLLSRRARRAAALALAVDSLAPPSSAWLSFVSRWLTKDNHTGGPGPVPGPGWLALRLLDNGAYAAGLWAGILRQRRLGAALPRLSGSRARPPHGGGARHRPHG